MVLTEKPQADRLKESVTILKKLTHDLGMSYDSPEIQELKGHLDAYIREGTCWAGTIPFPTYGRSAKVNLPRASHRTIEVTLIAK